MSILHFLNMMLCQFFSLHTPFHIWWHNIEEYKRNLMTKPLNNDHFKISNSPILILTWKYIRINTSNKLPKHIVWFQQTFSTWTIIIRLMPWLRIKKKRKINIFYPKTSGIKIIILHYFKVLYHLCAAISYCWFMN